MLAVRLAAIDIGSNSVRCTIVDVPVGAPRTTLDDEKAYTRLGRGITSTGRLSDDSMDETVAALKRMLSIAAEHEVTHLRAVATAAIRTASNGRDFVDRIERELGLQVEIISEEHEGRLAYLSAAESVDMGAGGAVIDIGGASVEIVRAEAGTIESVTSLPLGAVVMSERFHARDPMTRANHKRLAEHVRAALAPTQAVQDLPVPTVVGSGGTVTAVATIVAAEKGLPPDNVHGFRISRADLTTLRKRLVDADAKERALMRGMPESRIDLIVAGVAVLEAIVNALEAPGLVVNARGMREGIIVETVNRERGVESTLDRMRSVRELARKYDDRVPHSEQVARLSLELFDALEPLLDLGREQRPLLDAAALLHDVGYHVSYEAHHKHSFQLISQSALPGFSACERRIIAATARYHKGSLPKPKHEAMQGVDADERVTIERLAAILRLADGLDRSGGQRVTAIEVELLPGTLTIGIAGRPPFDAEIYGAMRKADLFEQVWPVNVRIVESPGA